MRSGRIGKWYTAAAVVGFAAVSFAPGAARAQALTLHKFSLGISPVTSTAADPSALSIDAAGNAWVAEPASSEIAEITPDGAVANYIAFPTKSPPAVIDIITGSDGNQWFADSANEGIGFITGDGVVNEYVFPTLSPVAIAQGPDADVWFTESTGLLIGQMRPDGQTTYYSAGISPGADIQGIAPGSDGNMWFGEPGTDRIGKITPQGRIFEYGTGISPSAGVSSLILGPDGNIWFAEANTGKIGKVTPAGVITEYATNIASDRLPLALAPGPDGNIWFGELGLNSHRIGKITPSGVVTAYNTDTPNVIIPEDVSHIALGPNNTIWYTQTAQDTASVLSIEPETALAAAVLPGGRSVGLNALATVYATMMNSSGSAMTNCQVGLPAIAPAGMLVNYQMTDPTTNLPIGTLNTPFTLAANNGSQSLLLTFESPTPAILENFAPVFSCNGIAAATEGGVDTLDLNFTAESSPDDIALAASTTPGIVSVPVLGSAAFSVAMINVGDSTTNGTTTLVGVDTGLAVLPVNVTVCQTNAATGACLATPEPLQYWSLPAGSTATFSVFVSATGPVAFDPANNRVFIRFIDYDDLRGLYISHGSASVALQTQ